MRTYLHRTARCALAVLGIFFAVSIVQAIRSTLPEFPHTIFDWISTLAQTALSALLVGALLALWVGWDEIKWPKPVKQIQFAYERLLGWFFILGGGVQIGAALFHLGTQVTHWFQTGIWKSVPLCQSFPVLPHLQWAFADAALTWLMGTPVWIWAAAIGALLIRMGLSNLTTSNSEANP